MPFEGKHVAGTVLWGCRTENSWEWDEVLAP